MKKHLLHRQSLMKNHSAAGELSKKRGQLIFGRAIVTMPFWKKLMSALCLV